jgi:hypothetical protein
MDNPETLAKLYSTFLLLVAFPKTGKILHVGREVTPIKTYNFTIKFGSIA